MYVSVSRTRAKRGGHIENWRKLAKMVKKRSICVRAYLRVHSIPPFPKSFFDSCS